MKLSTFLAILCLMFSSELDGQTLAPVTGAGSVCAQVDLNMVCDPNCGTKWFEVSSDEGANYLSVSINKNNSSICLIENDCEGVKLIETTESFFNHKIVPQSTYYIGVNNIDEEFNLCVQSFVLLTDCAETIDVTVTRPENPNLENTGPYFPGETVNFCCHIDFIIGAIGEPESNNCQWIQGVIPVVGGGWDLDETPLANQGPTNAEWLDEGLVDYNVFSPILESTTECDGRMGLQLGQEGLEPGSLLPAGWWMVSPGGSNCENDGTPDTMWGLPGGCGSSQSVEFCFDLKVKELEDLENNCSRDLKVDIFPFADGETGCWVNESCSFDIPFMLRATLDENSISSLDELADKIKISPNPVSDFLKITGFSEDLNYAIINLQGQVILSGKTNGTIDMSELNEGMYNIQLKTIKGANIVQRKIFKL